MPGSIKGNTWSSLVMMEQFFSGFAVVVPKIYSCEDCTGPSSATHRHINESVWKLERTEKE